MYNIYIRQRKESFWVRGRCMRRQKPEIFLALNVGNTARMGVKYYFFGSICTNPPVDCSFNIIQMVLDDKSTVPARVM